MHKQNGFSLIEVIVTMAIAAIVLTIGIPSFQSYIQNNRQTIAINELATALQLARNSAISRRVAVTLCKSPDGTDCATGDDSGDWSQGWIIFADTDGDNILDDDENILRVHGAIQGNVTLSGDGNTNDSVAFSPRGLLATANGTITYCDDRGSASALVISRAGRVRFEDNENNLTC